MPETLSENRAWSWRLFELFLKLTAWQKCGYRIILGVRREFGVS